MPLTFLVEEEFLLHRPVLILQPSELQSKPGQNCISQPGKMHCYQVSMYISMFVVGFRRWRGYFWLLNESLTLKGPAA
jgi:hypothetical protein